MAVNVHKGIQQRDIEVGRNVGNRILRWLDRMKPSAEIRPRPQGSNDMVSRHVMSSGKHVPGITEPEANKGRQLFAPLNTRLPSISLMMMQPKKTAGMSGQYRRMGYSGGRFEGVFRRDIAQWLPR